MTIVHITHRTRGIAGASARQGALYGSAWPVAFLAQSMIVGGLAQAGASGEVISLAANAIAALVVGLLYIAGRPALARDLHVRARRAGWR